MTIILTIIMTIIMIIIIFTIMTLMIRLFDKDWIENKIVVSKYENKNK